MIANKDLQKLRILVSMTTAVENKDQIILKIFRMFLGVKLISKIKLCFSSERFLRMHLAICLLEWMAYTIQSYILLNSQYLIN